MGAEFELFRDLVGAGNQGGYSSRSLLWGQPTGNFQRKINGL